MAIIEVQVVMPYEKARRNKLATKVLRDHWQDYPAPGIYYTLWKEDELLRSMMPGW